MDNSQVGFLKNARKIETPKKDEAPSFLTNAKRISSSQKENFSPYDDEDYLEREIERNIAQFTSRQIEGIFGLPGDFVSLVGRLTGLDQKKVPLSEEESIEQGLEPGQGFKMERKEPSLPTSSSLRKKSEELSSGYTKSRNEFEEKVGNVVQNVTARHIPIGRTNIFSRFMTPLAGEGVELGAKKLGLNEDNATKLNYATQVGLDLMQLSNPSKVTSDLYNQARQQAQGLSLNASPISNRISQLKDKWIKEVRSTDNPGVRVLEDIEKAASNGRYTAEQLMDARRRVNTVRQDLGHFSVGGGARSSGKKALNEVDEILNDALEHLGKSKPDFIKSYRDAAQAHRAIQQSNTISDYLSKNYTDGFLSKSAPLLFATASHIPSSLQGMTKTAIGAAKTATMAYPIYKSGQTLWRVFNSPKLASHYANVIGSASKSPLSEAERKKQKREVDENMRKLDNELFRMEMKGDI
jgi:hypothetical protein